MFSLFLLLVSVYPQADHCISDELFDSVTETIGNYACLQKNKPNIHLDNYNIILDENGHIFSGPDAQTDISGSISWCSFSVDFRVKQKLVLHKKKPSTLGFRLKFKAYLYGKFIYILTPKEMIDAGIGIDFFYIWKFNVQFILGFMSLGFGVGFDITQNFGAVIGIVNPYWKFELSPILGFYFTF
jgi:hypothetical protein